MAVRELASGAKEGATVAGNVFTLTGALDGGITFNNAATDAALLSVYAFQDSDPTIFEVMAVTLEHATPKLTRTATIQSSTGSAITFVGTVTVYRALTDADLDPNRFGLTPVAVVAGLTSDQSITAATEATLTGWTEALDAGSNFNATTGTFTAPDDDWYVFSGLFRFNVGSIGDRLRVTLSPSVGSELVVYAEAVTASTNSVILPSLWLDLDASDTVTINVENLESNDSVDSTSTQIQITRAVY